MRYPYQQPAEGQRTHDLDIEVRYKETDQMGVVHHANYLVWFELGRTGLCALSGHRYADIEKRGYWLMVTGAHLDYREGARYGDTVRVTTWVVRVASRLLHFGYRVARLEPTTGEPDALLVRGITEHAWVDAATRRVCRVDAELEQAFRSLA